MKFLLGKKLGMTQIFSEEGKVLPVTLVEVPSNYILRVKGQEKDGYGAYVIATGKKKNAGEKTQQYNFKKITEFKNSSEKVEFEQGKEISVDIFSKDDKVKITSVSKGKGFQGVVKRHGFKGGPASHGHKHNLRQPGSIGAIFPMRVIKGKRMAGRMGSDQVTKKTKIVDVLLEEKIIAVKGPVPGRKGSWVKIVSLS
ncbi:MAG: 50S ribosomal protein L3 [bacterium]